MGSSVRSTACLRYENRIALLEKLRGYNLTENAKEHLAEKSSHYSLLFISKMAAEKKLRVVDYIIINNTKKIKNTKIARTFHKYNMLKDYTEKDEYIRILI